MEHSLSWEVDSQSYSQEIISLSWKPKVHYHVYNTLHLGHILSQLNPVHNLTLYDLKLILILFPTIHLVVSSGLAPSGFLTELKATLNFMLQFIFAECVTYFKIYRRIVFKELECKINDFTCIN
jgi:hypothetical protein